MPKPSGTAPTIAGVVLALATATLTTPASASPAGTRAVSTARAVATGIFSYHSPDSGDLEIEDPDNGECRLLLQGATSAANHTDTRATLFHDHDCEEPLGRMNPGEEKTFPDPIPHSVIFG